MAINTKRVIEAAAQPRPVPGLYLRNGLVVLVTPYKSQPWSAPAPFVTPYQSTYLEGNPIGEQNSLTAADFEGLTPWDGAITLQNEVDL